jgi:hypothetical protein
MKQCEYSKCRKEFDPQKPKARFCSDKCRVYGNREKRVGEKVVRVKDANKQTTAAPDLTENKPTSNYTIDTRVPPMPTRNKGEGVFDFAARKNEWKLKYNQ